MKKAILIITALTLFAFKTADNRSNYIVPLAAWSVTADDIDLDGDNDIVVGHNYSFQTEWSGVSILLNNGDGYFSLYDSVFLFGGQSDIIIENTDDQGSKEIIAKYIDQQIDNEYIAVINDFNLNHISYFSLDTYDGIGSKVCGDINNDGNTDIVVASSGNHFWGVMYNDGMGYFSAPEYHYAQDFYNIGIACGDLNNDGRDDVIVHGQKAEIFFSYPDGFQKQVLETEDYLLSVHIVDFDLDGLNDIIAFDDIIGAFTPIFIYRNIDGTNFERLPKIVKQPGAHIYSINDFNNDSLPDILLQLANFSGYMLYYNEGNFQLGDSTFISLEGYEYEGWRNCYCADMDGNNYTDIITIRTSYVTLPDNLVILFNDGNGNFVDEPVTMINQPDKTATNTFTCFPNPFTNEITFEININKTSGVELLVYDLQGKIIRCLTNKIKKGGQSFKIKWDGLDQHGKPCKPGPYFAYLKVNGKIHQTIKLIKI